MSSSSSSPSPLSNSSLLLRERLDLEEGILSLGRPVPLFGRLSQAQKMLKIPLLFPEFYLSPQEGRSLKSYVNEPLVPSHPFFSKLNEQIAFLEEREGVDLSVGAFKNDLIDYISRVCTVEGKPRWRLLKGEVRLFVYLRARPLCLAISQREGRQMASLDSYNQLAKTNRYGASAVFEERDRGLFFKRADRNPLFPGLERFFGELAARLGEIDSPSFLLVKLDNLFVREIPPQFAERLAQTGKRIAAYFHNHPDEKATFPFHESRVAHLFQVPKGVPGESLEPLLRPSSSVRLEDAISISSFTRGVVLDLVSLLRDGRIDNFLLNFISRDLRSIDYDNGCGPPIEDGVLKCRTLRFLLDPLMSQPIDPSYQDYFLELNVDTLLVDLVASVARFNELNEKLIEEGLFKQEELERLSLPVTLSSAALVYIHETLELIQKLFRERPGMSHWELLEAVQPSLYRIYRPLVEQCGILDAHDRLFTRAGYPRINDLPALQPPPLIELVKESRYPPKTPLRLPFVALEEWVEATFGGISAARQESIISKISASFSQAEAVKLSYLEIREEVLIRLIGQFSSLKEITIFGGKSITIVALKSILSDYPELELVITEDPRLRLSDLSELIRFAWTEGRSLSFLIKKNKYPIQRGRLDEVLQEALLDNSLLFSRVLIDLQAQIKPSTFLRLIADNLPVQAVDFLIDCGVHHLVSVPLSRTLLHFAAYHGNYNAAKSLLQSDISPFAVDETGSTALHLAIFPKATPSIAELILKKLSPEQRRSILLTKDNDGRLPLHLAAQQSDAMVAKILIRFGLKVGAEEQVNIRDRFGNTPLELAIKWKADDVAARLRSAQLDSKQVVEASSFTKWIKLPDQISVFEEKSRVFLEKKEYVSAAVALASAFKSIERGLLPRSYITSLETQLYRIECLFVYEALQEAIPPNLENRIGNHRNILMTTRFEALKKIREGGEKAAQSVQYSLIETYKKILCEMFSESLSLLGLASQKCALVALDGFSRNETLDSSSLEFVVLIEKKSSIKSFELVAQLLKIKIASLGETFPFYYFSNEPFDDLLQFGFELGRGTIVDIPKEAAARLYRQFVHRSRLYGDKNLFRNFEYTKPWYSLVFSSIEDSSKEEGAMILKECDARFKIYNEEKKIRCLKELYSMFGDALQGVILCSGKNGLTTREGICQLSFSPQAKEALLATFDKLLFWNLYPQLERWAGNQPPTITEIVYQELFDCVADFYNKMVRQSTPFDRVALRRSVSSVIHIGSGVETGSSSSGTSSSSSSSLPMSGPLEVDRGRYRPYLFSLLPQWREEIKKAEADLERWESSSYLSEEFRELKIANILASLGDSYTNIGELQKAKDFYNRSLGKYEKYSKEIQINNISLQLIYLYVVGGNLSEAHKELCSFLEKKKEAYSSNDRIIIARTYSSLGAVCTYLGRYLEAERYCKESRAMLERINKDGKLDLDIAIAQVRLGDVYNGQGDYSAAIDLYYLALEALKDSYEQPHPEVAYCLNSLGETYANLGDFSAAIEYYSAALKMLKEIPGSQPDRDIVRSEVGLMIAEAQSGDPLDAIQSYGRLQGLTSLSDQNSARIQTGLAAAQFRLGLLEQALTTYQAALQIFEQVYKDRPHLDIAICLHKMGNVCAKLHDDEKAEDYYKRSLERLETLYGESHLSVARLKNDFGGFAEASRNYSLAIEFYRSALEIYRQICPELPTTSSKEEDHLIADFLDLIVRGAPKESPSMSRGQAAQSTQVFEAAALVLTDIGCVLGNVGRVYEGKDTLLSSLLVYKEIYSSRLVLKISEAFSYLAFSYKELNNYQLSIECFKISLFLKERFYENKPNARVAKGVANIGEAFAHFECYQEAICYFKRAIEIHNYLDEEGPSFEVANFLISLSKSHAKLNRFEDAIKDLSGSFLIYRSRLNERTELDVADGCTNLGNLFVGLGSNGSREAVKCYELALELYHKNHLWTAVHFINHNLGNAYLNLGEFDKAIDYFQASIASKREAYRDSPDSIPIKRSLAGSLMSLGRAYLSLGKFEEAIRSYEEAHGLLIEIDGVDSPDAQRISETINAVRARLIS